MPPRISSEAAAPSRNTWLCPGCSKWVDMGREVTQGRKMRHLKECDPAMHARRVAHNRAQDAMPDELAIPGVEDEAVLAAADD